jgi:FAD synthetase
MFMYFSFFVLLFFFGVNLTIGQVIEECLSRYEPSEVCVSFNGGKDCSALLHLIHAAWIRRRSSFVSTDRLRLRALYIRGQDPFPEMEQFIEDTRQRQPFFLVLFPIPSYILL